MQKNLLITLCIALLLGIAASHLFAAQDGYIPGIRIVFEVRTPQGDLRSYQRPGVPPTYWAQDMPVVKGDVVSINPLIATGGADLKEVRIRLDGKELSRSIQSPWRYDMNTADLGEGYHIVEVWASAKAKRTEENSASTSFLVVPQTDPLLRMLQVSPEADLPVTDEERLSCTLRARDPQVDQDITKSSLAKVDKPMLLFVSCGTESKEYFYTLSRDGRITYTSPILPLLTHIQIEPCGPDGVGQAPGEVILTVRAGDGAGRFGPPAWATLQVGVEKVEK